MKKLTWLLSLACPGCLAFGLTACDFLPLNSDSSTGKISSSEPTFSENLAYSLSEDNKYYSVTGIGSCTDSNVVIPSTYEGLPVKVIERGAFANNETMQSIVLADSITTIYDEAFAYCKNLNSVTIPDSLTYIHPYVFNTCSNLTDVHVVSLEAWCNILFANEYSSPLRYADNFYVNNELLTELVIPESISTIQSYAFFGYSKLTSVVFHNGVTEIKADAFKYCSKLTDVYAPDFSSWLAISFKNSYSNPLQYAENWYVNDAPVTELVIPEGVTSVKPYILGGDVNVTKATIPSHVVSIESCAFLGNEKLTSVVISEGVTTIDGWAFGECTGLTSILIPDSVTAIGYAAFSDCSNLETVTIGDGVTAIQDKAFANCINLTEITIGKSVASFGLFVFDRCEKLTRVNVTDLSAWCGINFQSNPLSIAKKLYVNGELVTDLIIPDTVTEIKYNAFGWCESLTSVIIDNNVTKIGIQAFTNCINLTTAVVGDGVTLIDEYAFSFCTALTDVTIGENVNNISRLAFQSCDLLANATFKNPIGWKSGSSSLELSDTKTAADILKAAHYDLIRE